MEARKKDPTKPKLFWVEGADSAGCFCYKVPSSTCLIKGSPFPCAGKQRKNKASWKKMDRQQTQTSMSWEPMLQSLLQGFLDHAANWGKHMSKFLCQDSTSKRHFRMSRQQLPVRAAARAGMWAKSRAGWIFFGCLYCSLQETPELPIYTQTLL